MSEFQFYQFVAVDRPLDADQLGELRELSTRAILTPTSFVNTYQWGNFKGSPELLMEEYYDGHLYFANWGYRKVILRWPVDQLPMEVAARYCPGDSATARRHSDHVMLTLVSDDEGGELGDFSDLFEYGDGEEQWLPSIARARLDVALGDLRLLYLAWLLCLHNGDLDDTVVEPPLPAGLADLPDSLRDLAFFLRIDPDLIAAASRPLPELPPAPAPADYRTWIGQQPRGEKDAVLLRLLQGDVSYALTELRRRFHQDRPRSVCAEPGRTAGQLRAATLAQAAQRLAREQREEAARNAAAREQARAAQQRRLADLAQDPEAAWTRVNTLIANRTGVNYPAAVQLLGDLRALAERDGTREIFDERYRRFCSAHPTKKALLRQLDAAGL